MMGHNSSQTQLAALATAITAAEKTHHTSKIQHALEQGARLSEAWKLLNGNKKEFGEWLRSSKLLDQVGRDNVLRFRNLHDNFGEISVETIKKIGLSRCYKLTDQAVREEVIDFAESSVAKLTDQDIKTITDRVHPKPEPEPDPDPKPEPDPDPKPDPKQSGGIAFELTGDEAAVAARVLDGEITYDRAVVELGKSNIVIRKITAWLSGYRSAARDNAVDQTLSLTGKKKLEAAHRRLERDFERAVAAKAQTMVEAEVDRRTKGIERQVRIVYDHVQSIQKNGKSMLTPDGYRAIRKCLLGTGSPSPETKREAGDAFNALGIKPLTQDQVDRAKAWKEEVERALHENRDR